MRLTSPIFMLAPFRPPNRKRPRMDPTFPVDVKEKVHKKGFLKRLGMSFRASFSPKTVALPQQVIDDFYSDEVDYAEDDGDDDYFDSIKSYIDLETEESNNVIEEQVEAVLQGKDAVSQTATGQLQPTLPYSSTPFHKNQNLHATSLQPTQVEPATFAT